jgi:hypothetical protein
MPFAKLYPAYVNKAERKGRTREEVDRIICWLTGYAPEDMRRQIELGIDLEAFFAQAPAMHPNRTLVRGVVCGVRVEEVADPLMRELRRLDKLIDELANGRPMEKILRQQAGGSPDGEARAAGTVRGGGAGGCRERTGRGAKPQRR